MFGDKTFGGTSLGIHLCHGNNMNRLISAILALSFLMTTLGAFTAHIHAPAVLLNENRGTLTNISLNITSGTGLVNISGPAEVGNSTLASAMSAAAYASAYVGVNESAYDFRYYIRDSSVNVSGPSAGLAFAMLAVSSLTKRPLLDNFTVTGTIDAAGDVGEVGGIYDKVGTAAHHGMLYVLVPYTSDTSERLLYYIAQQLYGIPLIEVSNLSEALQYAYTYNSRGITPMHLNVSQNYMTSSISNATLQCVSCNTSGFASLTNYTFNFTAAEIDALGGKYQASKEAMLAQLGNYTKIASKGYLYTGADLAFLEYTDAFTLANSANISKASTLSLLDNVSGYCSALAPPALTDTNYEYVIGGELRQEWGIINIEGAYALLNASETTDGLINSIYVAAPSNAWCSAAAEMYDIASSMGGSTVNLSSSAKSAAFRAINNVRQYGSSLYLQSAIKSYNESEYAVALYSAVYASVFGSGTPQINYSDSKVVSEIRANIANSTYGIWPSQFGDEASFYLQEAAIRSKNGTNASISSAYEVSLLGKELASTNKELTGWFVAGSGVRKPVQANSAYDMGAISAEIQSENTFITVMFAVLFVMLLIVLLLLIRLNGMCNALGRGRRNKRRG